MPKKEKLISLTEQLVIGDPVAIQEEQKLLQTVQQLITPNVQEKVVHEKQTPNTDKLVVKNSVVTSKPAKTELEVFYKYITILLYHISFHMLNVLVLNIPHTIYIGCNNNPCT